MVDSFGHHKESIELQEKADFNNLEQRSQLAMSWENILQEYYEHFTREGHQIGLESLSTYRRTSHWRPIWDNFDREHCRIVHGG